MTSPNTAETFKAGLLALGISIGSARERPDLSTAARVLEMTTNAEPGMADAWLARLAAGQRSVGVYEGLWRARTRLGQRLAHYGLTPASLNERVNAYLVRLPLNSAGAATAAYLCSLAAAGDYDTATEVYEQSRADGTADAATTYCLATMYYTTERWPQVIETAQQVRGHDVDPTLVAAAATLVVSARAHLGLHQAAVELAGAPLPDGRTLTEAVPSAAAMVFYHVGMCHRALGNEQAATEALRAALTADPSMAVAQHMLSEPTLVLDTTDQRHIDSRTDPWDPATAADRSALLREQFAQTRADTLAQATAELDQYVGVPELKREVRKLRASIEVNKVRAAEGLPSTTRSHHLVFAGPPGTGKTTIARIVAKIYSGLGILATDRVREVRRAELVGQYIGETENKTNAVIDSALDGVLLLDEAYTLANTGARNDFGPVAIDTLLARMENDRDRLMVIAAGYADDMELFLSANQGLSGRFHRTIHFPSYTVEELVQIAQGMAARTEHVITDGAAEVLYEVCTALSELHVPDVDDAANPQRRRPGLDIAGNARFMRKIVEQAVEEQELRVSELNQFSKADLTELTAQDVRLAARQSIPSRVQRELGADSPWR